MGLLTVKLVLCHSLGKQVDQVGRTIKCATKRHFYDGRKSLTPNGQVIYVHLVPIMVLNGVDKSIPFGFIQVNFTVCCLHYVICVDQKLNIRTISDRVTM